MANLKGNLRYLADVPEALIAKLLDKLKQADSLWVIADRVKPNAFPVFEHGARHIVFQYPEDQADHTRSRTYPWWPHFSQEIADVVDHVCRPYAYTLGRTSRIMLAKLLPNSGIAPHIDSAASARVPHKIHVPLTTHAGVTMTIDNTSYHLKQGGSYEVNNRLEHSAQNRSPNERLHLIFDYYDAQ